MTVALLNACGGGGGGGGSAGSASGSLSGTVIDGYLEGAKVCLDVNSNGTCDSGEPSATTDNGGKYQLALGNINAAGLNLIAEIPATAKDSVLPCWRLVSRHTPWWPLRRSPQL
jgi:hypothetical protein